MRPKLVSSPTIQKVQDRRFYTELIRQCEVVLPMVDEGEGLCKFLNKENELKKVIKSILKTNYVTFLGTFYSPVPARYAIETRYTPAWKQDRIELLNEIVNYCKSKL
jgi:hypothetical protein